jgi:hypothetical protein
MEARAAGKGARSTSESGIISSLLSHGSREGEAKSCLSYWEAALSVNDRQVFFYLSLTVNSDTKSAKPHETRYSGSYRPIFHSGTFLPFLLDLW